jgi:transcriptional regulator with XRE-family HTH domain
VPPHGGGMEDIMKLQEKIYYCRKKSGLSQESLAEQLGVSRQAISKWENGDAEPEISKLRLLAMAFGVTTDWLLNEEEPEKEKNISLESAPNPTAPNTNWVESVPGVLGKLFRRYGWLVGVWLAVGGTGFTLIGALARYLTRRMFSGFTQNPFSDMNNVFSDGTIYYDQFGNQMSNTFSDIAANNPVSIMGTVIMVIGIIMIISGVILAILLKKRSNSN